MERLSSLPNSPEPPSQFSRWFDWIFTAKRSKSLGLSAAMSLLVASIEHFTEPNFSLGFLYSFPCLLASAHLSRGQVVLTALALSVLRETFAPYSWDSQGPSRVLLVFLANVGMGLFSSEVARNRRLNARHLASLQTEIAGREEAEKQLRTIIESSPAAILTVSESGQIDMANRAAHDLFAVTEGGLPGQSVGHFLPVVAELLASESEGQSYRAATSCRGRRKGGDPFLACVWFSTYEAPTGKRLAAIVTDSSDDLRDWQESSLQNLLRSTRVLVGSVSHEIRNICAAINVVYTNLGRLPGVSGTADYEALGSLTAGLAKVATVELQAASSDVPEQFVDLHAVLDELRIVLEPQISAHEIVFVFDVSAELPLVRGDHHGLLQVFLNLTRNAFRALEGIAEPRLTIKATAGRMVMVRIIDNGPGILFPERLFQPFQHGSDATGLGLFVARAIVRAVGGELYHERSSEGCIMCVAVPCFDKNVEAEPAALQTGTTE